jgi:3'-5' exoribonuclease
MTTIEKTGIVNLTNLMVGDQVEGFFLVRSAEEGIASNQKPYLTLKLITKTGEIEGKIWGCTEEQKEQCKAEEIIKIRATVTEYKGVLQFNISKIRRATEEDGISVSDLLPVAPVDKQEVEREIIETVLSFKNTELRELTLKLYRKFREKFLVHVAAKSNHHNLISGLAYHTVSMLKLAKQIAPLYPMVNAELLYAGIILHDLGKTRELSDSFIAPDYTIEGSLLGHISIMASEVQQAANELIKEGVIKKESLIPSLLTHCILSHHGKLEFGSPVEPRIIEAELLHHIDMIDSRMYMIGNALQGGEKGQFVRVPALRRDFLVH